MASESDKRPGLVLRVTPNGAKVFRWRLRSLGKMITIGRFSAKPQEGCVTTTWGATSVPVQCCVIVQRNPPMSATRADGSTGAPSAPEVSDRSPDSAT